MKFYLRKIKKIQVLDCLLVEIQNGKKYKFNYSNIKRIHIKVVKKPYFNFTYLIVFTYIILSLTINSFFAIIGINIFFLTIVIYISIYKNMKYNLIVELNNNDLLKFSFSNSIKYKIIDTIQYVRKKIN